MTQLLADRANTIGDALLRELFLQRLPTNVQMLWQTRLLTSPLHPSPLHPSPLHPSPLHPSANAVTVTHTATQDDEILRAVNNNADVQHLVEGILITRARHVHRASVTTIAALDPKPDTASGLVPGRETGRPTSILRFTLCCTAANLEARAHSVGSRS
ncbi:hypothetical protein HPB47_013062 [Ixodes persulcatus]|uniref:Uncharacterized protein n=1 Tax=Ixodes persulcatus TaxID=34615 RepID=A0AC60NRR5_IXOPE|nr:hypothetical protein HPB47_013062 [Ixodes persulcatus]